MVCCLHVARVQEVSEHLQNILKAKGDQLKVVVHVGRDYMGRKWDEVLQRTYLGVHDITP